MSPDRSITRSIEHVAEDYRVVMIDQREEEEKRRESIDWNRSIS